MTFEAFSLDPLVQDSLREMGYEKPTPIQEQAIPLILQGRDLIGLSETGSGKTAACAIPLIHQVDTQEPRIQVLVVVPTRELALQYATETQKIGRLKQVKVFAILGGEDMALQLAKLKAGVHVLIATPGRLIDLIYSHSIHLGNVQTLILDEADQMLGMGFVEDLEFIMQCLVQKHQTLLFSATMPEAIQKIAKTYMKDPAELKLIGEKASPKSLRHLFTFCQPTHKIQDLLDLLQKENPKGCLIFANSRKEVENLMYKLKRELPFVDFLHGGLEQSTRSIVTQKFSKGKIRYLIATDVASRGLDFSQVTHVINYHFPFDSETYLHRAGRTGRSGREGICITLVTQKEVGRVKQLQKILGDTGEWLKTPPHRSS